MHDSWRLCVDALVSKMNLQNRASGWVNLNDFGIPLSLAGLRLLNMLSSGEKKYLGTWKVVDIWDLDFCSEWLNFDDFATVDFD